MNTEQLQFNKVMSNDFPEFLSSKLVVKKGVEFYLMPITSISYFYCENRITYLKDLVGNKFIIEKPLVELESDLSRLLFRRVARNVLLNIDHVQKFKNIESGKIEVFTTDNSSIVVSQFYATTFRKLFR